MKTWAKINGVLMLLICGWLSIHTASAACSSDNVHVLAGSMFFNIPSYGVSTGNPVGDWWQVSSPLATDCSEQIYSVVAFGYSSFSGQTYTDGGVVYNVYNTGVPGIGFIAAISDSISGVFYPMPKTGVSTFSTTPYTGIPHGTSVSATIKVKFITTATLTPGVYNIPTLNLMAVNIVGISQAQIIGQGWVTTDPSNVSVIANTCSVDVDSQNQSVTLADVTSSDLPDVGSTAKDKTFNISMNCQSQVYIFVMLNGTPNPDTTADGVLQVSNAGVAGTSQGIGIQILNNGTPMPIRSNMPVKFIESGGQESIPFTVRYYRTLNNMTAGSANATATLNVNYR